MATSAQPTSDYANARDPREEQFFDDLFGTTKVMVILRGATPEASVAMAQEAWDHGVKAVEVTVAEAAHLESLRAVVAAGRGRGVKVGAGSIYRVAQVALVAEAGVDFTVAPSIDADVSHACQEAKLPYLPGVATSTDITLAEKLGHTWLKAFPAAELGTRWFAAMRGPFPWPKWVATGGMTLNSAPDFLAAGADVIGMGTRIDDWSDAAFLLGE
jgi:2-dehydro-3-deoxyphosphogluconate aldolase / (4S)-4-hydroxy-2-oxoglutarate aldolase